MFVSNAGIAQFSPTAEHADNEWQEILTVNLTSPIALTKALLNGGPRRSTDNPFHIVFISSVAALRGVAQTAVYSASKAAIDGFARSLAREVGPQGIHVNVVNPGWTKTDMTDGVEHPSNNPIAGWIEPNAIADAVVFLSKSKNITGANIVVDNGFSI